MKIDLIAFNCRYSHSCLALFYVRNELEKNLANCQVHLSQLTINDPYYETLLGLSARGAEWLFFSVYIWNAGYVRRLIDDLAQTVPEQKIVLGGPQAQVFTDLPETCTVISGEIEGLPEKFYDDLATGALAPYYEAKAASSFSSPYRLEDFGSGLKNRNIYYESTRGCPFSCAYCLSSISRGVVSLPLDQVRAELTKIVRENPKIIKFVDRTFNADPERTMAIWRFLVEQPGETLFHFEIAPDLFSEEMFLFLAGVPVGKFQFEIGVQSTNPASLSAVNRKMDVELAKRNIRRLVGMANIHLHLDLILGLPYETAESFMTSINDVFVLEPHHVQMGLLKVLPGTQIQGQALEYGLVSCLMPPYQVTATSWMNHAVMSHLYWLGECIEAFYNNRYFRNFFLYANLAGAEFAQLFEELLKGAQAGGLFQRAKTQKLLNSILVRFIKGYPGQKMLRELLIFDWLSCGHRYLPPELYDESVNTFSDYLWQEMPQEVSGLYNRNSRNRFFKKGIFYKFSKELLKKIDLPVTAGQRGFVCFLPEQKEGVFKHNKAVVIA